jgi:tRNA pseudouridine55 synthase
VLPLACGRATRLVRFLTASEKEYDATILFGLTTDTLDVTGTETTRSGVAPTRDAVVEALSALTGEYLQTPPAYSAKKVGGRRAYALARRDEPVELAPVLVRVPRIELLEFGNDRCRISLTCSAGFYVRALVRDIGAHCGTGACMEALRRTRSGEFTLDEALPLAALAEEQDLMASLIPMERLLSHFPAATVTTEGLVRVSRGQQVRASDLAGAPPPPSAAWVRLLDASGALIGLGTPETAPGSLHPEVVLV